MLSSVAHRAISGICIAGVLALSSTPSAQAAPTLECFDETDRPEVVYIAGSSAARPFMGVLAKLMATAESPYVLVYQSLGSCVGVERIFSANRSRRLITDIEDNYAQLYKADGSSEPCLLAPGGNEVDIGISDVFAETCGFSELTGLQIIDFQGPIQPMAFVVPAASTQRVISAEAAYLAFGRGGDSGNAAPWTDPDLFFIRNGSSGTQQMIAKAIGVPADQFWGIDRGGSSAVSDGLKLLADPGRAAISLGILTTSVADDERNNLRVLAFQAEGQQCGYWPDSSVTSLDKANVRDGHYPIWGPLHLYARVIDGVPSEAAGTVVGRFTVTRPDQAVVDAIIDQHLVPQCAMSVTRSAEMGPLQSLAPAFGCGCYFDFQANGAADCETCRGPGDCPTEKPACNFGYCELQ